MEHDYIKDIKSLILQAKPSYLSQEDITVEHKRSKVQSLLQVTFYWPQRSCGQGYVFTHVCDSVHRGGLRAGRTPPGRENPPRPGRPTLDRETPLDRENPPDQADTPLAGRTPPGPGRPPWTGRTPPDQADTPWQGGPPGPGKPPWTGRTPPDQADTPLAGRTPPDQADLPPGSRLQNTVYERPVHILLECFLVFVNFTLFFSM